MKVAGAPRALTATQTVLWACGVTHIANDCDAIVVMAVQVAGEAPLPFAGVASAS